MKISKETTSFFLYAGFKFTITSIVVFLCSTSLYAQQYIDYLGAGHDQGITISSSGQDASSPMGNCLSGVGLNPDFGATARFLTQATLGADYETVEAVQNMGIGQWINDQMQVPASDYLLVAMDYHEFLDSLLVLSGTNPNDFSPLDFRFPTFRNAWWQISMNEDDLLRQKIAYALSQIMVISSQSNLDDHGEGFASFYNMLMQNSFGNFRDLLMDVTLHPMMGLYLSHYNNPKTNLVINTRPDENYAREIMQLFSIGLFELNLDGSRKLDTDGQAIPTYTNDDIKEFAKIFTGLGGENFFGQYFGAIDKTIPMTMWETEHEPGEKVLLNGYVVPDGQTGMEDINNAIDHLFNHPNVGPFIAYRLIQRMVKSNPTPQYVERVAKAFNDNGFGVRGDMAAVVKAILLDSEARDCSWLDVFNAGKLREPFLRRIHLARAFNLGNDANRLFNTAWRIDRHLSQSIMSSPTVFNFYQTDYQPSGIIKDLGQVSPEFQITNSTTSIGYINEIYMCMIWGEFEWEYILDESLLADPDTFYEAYDSKIDLSDEMALVNDAEALVERLNQLLCYGKMSDETRATIVSCVDQMWSGDLEQKVNSAIYLTCISPDFAILR